MPSKRYNAEAILHKLREADVLLGQEPKRQRGVSTARCQRANL